NHRAVERFRVLGRLLLFPQVLLRGLVGLLLCLVNLVRVLATGGLVELVPGLLDAALRLLRLDLAAGAVCDVANGLADTHDGPPSIVTIGRLADHLPRLRAVGGPPPPLCDGTAGGSPVQSSSSSWSSSSLLSPLSLSSLSWWSSSLSSQPPSSRSSTQSWTSTCPSSISTSSSRSSPPR